MEMFLYGRYLFFYAMSRYSISMNHTAQFVMIVQQCYLCALFLVDFLVFTCRYFSQWLRVIKSSYQSSYSVNALTLLVG